MAIKGLSIPVFGKYNYDSAKGTVTYTDGMINPHAIEYTFTPEAADGTPLYGDNRIIENDRQTFSTGTLSLGIDDLVQEVSKYLLGVKTVEQEYGDGKTAVVTVYDDDQNAPTLGVGIIELHQNDDVDHYRAVILKKAIFNLPEDTATTRGESVKWQTKTIEGTVSRSDENTAEQKHPWINDAWFDSEADAVEWLKWCLGVGTLGTLTVQSAAGTTTGTTKITVTPAKTGENVYYYQLGENLELPGYNADCSGMTPWDGEEEITAETGTKILIVECEGTNARAAGIQTVTANGGE